MYTVKYGMLKNKKRNSLQIDAIEKRRKVKIHKALQNNNLQF